MRADMPKYTCAVCSAVVHVNLHARGFPPDAAKRKLVKWCRILGHESEPIYTAGYILP